MSIELAEAYSNVFNSPQGQIVLEDLIAQAEYFEPLKVADPNYALARLSKQTLVSHILTLSNCSDLVKQARNLIERNNK